MLKIESLDFQRLTSLLKCINTFHNLPFLFFVGQILIGNPSSHFIQPVT